jgi:dTDP-4-dehydrorhamnose reductase
MKKILSLHARQEVKYPYLLTLSRMMTFSYIAERAAGYPTIARRNQLSKLAFLNCKSAFQWKAPCWRERTAVPLILEVL